MTVADVEDVAPRGIASVESEQEGCKDEDDEDPKEEDQDEEEREGVLNCITNDR